MSWRAWKSQRHRAIPRVRFRSLQFEQFESRLPQATLPTGFAELLVSDGLLNLRRWNLRPTAGSLWRNKEET